MSGHDTHDEIEFSGVMSRFWGWVMAGWPRTVLERLWFGNPAGRILDLLDLEGGELVVDAGAGSGYYSLALARRLPGGEVVAVDISPTMLDILAKRVRWAGLQQRVAIREGDCGALPIEDGEADAALTVAVWHHLPDSELAARELFRVLKPGGKLVAVDWADAAGKGHRHHGNAGAFDPQAMIAHLTQAGFGSIEAETKGRWVIGYGRKPANGTLQ